MRHAIAGNKLGRNQTLRKATVRDIAKATLLRQRITTTKAKAKEARKMVDKLITLGKKDTLAAKRQAFSILCDHKLVSRLFGTIAPKFKERQGGYTRIILMNNRRGDNAQMALLELTEKDEIKISKPKKSSEGKTSSKSKKTSDENVGQATKSAPEPKDQGEKSSIKKDDHKTVDKTKGKSKNIVSGLKQMFNRKNSGGK